LDEVKRDLSLARCLHITGSFHWAPLKMGGAFHSECLSQTKNIKYSVDVNHFYIIF